uniref:Uncharacterized protein n=1 Tax=Arcella intermedia TaxID=1963864 RepID=A0A6B2L3Q5_9EUKA
MTTPYNFYIFPSNAEDTEFLCQSTSLYFLSTNKFDFNKWIGQGIQFMSRQEEQNLREANSKKRAMGLSERDRDYLDTLRKKLDVFLDSPDSSLSFSAANPYLCQLALQEIDSYEGQIEATPMTTPYKTTFLMINKSTASKESKIRRAIGFREVIDLIIQSKKPIVGHNCFMDLIHIYHRFVEPIPSSLLQFKHEFKKLFPLVFDTKVIAHLDPTISPLINDSTLEALHAQVKQKVGPISFVFEEGFERYGNCAMSHEAGFDAYLTGSIFIALFQHILQKPTSSPFPTDLDPLQPNKIYLYAKAYNNCYFDLDVNKEDCLPNLQNVFYCSGVSEVDDALKGYFASLSNTKEDPIITINDERSVFVHYSEPLGYKNTMEILNPRAPYTAYSFETYKSVRVRKALEEFKSRRSRPARASLPNELLYTPGLTGLTRKRTFSELQEREEQIDINSSLQNCMLM